jgi:cobalt-zinc-cadmium efflux system outer membrane protein
VEARWNAQEATRIDVAQAEMESERARISGEQVRNSYVTARKQLAAASGLAELPGEVLVGNANELPRHFTWEDALARVESTSPGLASLAAEVDRAAWSLQRARAQVAPNIDTQFSVQYDDASSYVITGVQVGGAIPLWNRQQGAIQQARYERMAAEQQLARERLRLRASLADTYARYISMRLQVEKFRERLLPSAESTMSLVSRSYEAGEVSYLELLTAQRTYFQTNLEYLDALSEFWKAYLQIDGLLLDRALEP